MPSKAEQSRAEQSRAEQAAPDCLDAYYRLTGSWPSPRVVPWLSSLADAHGEEAVSMALAAEWGIDASRATILSRTRDRLEREAHERGRERRARREAEQRAERERIESMPPEQRAANMARLREMLAAKGLV